MLNETIQQLMSSTLYMKIQAEPTRHSPNLLSGLASNVKAAVSGNPELEAQARQVFLEAFAGSPLAAQMGAIWEMSLATPATFQELTDSGAPANLCPVAEGSPVAMVRRELRKAAVAAKRLPHIQINDRDLSAVLEDARQALLASNNPPRLFMRNGSMVQLTQDNTIQEITAVTCRTRLGEAARWEKVHGEDKQTGEPETEVVFPPVDVATALVAEPPDALPALNEVVNFPIFSKGGRLIAEPGYHQEDGIYLTADVEGLVPPVPESPDDLEVERAKRLIEEEVLHDFQFKSQADKAHWYSMALLPLVLPMIDGPTPMHYFEAAMVGTGKTLLADVGALITTGQTVPWKGLPEAEAEKAQTIFSMLKSGSTYAGFDNVKHKVDSPNLEGVLTSTRWSARLMRTQSEGHVVNRAVWLMTGNNCELSDDLLRRSLRIRLDTAEDKPALRANFKHRNLRHWIREHRGKLLHALLTLVQRWVVAGRKPNTGRILNSFESWSEVVGGILQAVGIEGFLEVNLAEEASGDQEEDVAFLAAWEEKFQGLPVSAKDLYSEVCLENIPVQMGEKTMYRTQLAHLGGFFGKTADTARTRRLGHWLKKNRDRPMGGLVVRKAEHDAHLNAHRYRLERLTKQAQQQVVQEVALKAPMGDNPEFS